MKCWKSTINFTILMMSLVVSFTFLTDILTALHLCFDCCDFDINRILVLKLQLKQIKHIDLHHYSSMSQCFRWEANRFSGIFHSFNDILLGSPCPFSITFAAASCRSSAKHTNWRACESWIHRALLNQALSCKGWLSICHFTHEPSPNTFWYHLWGLDRQRGVK